MKIALLLLLVAGWVQLPAEGYFFKSHEPLVKRSSEVESDESYSKLCEPTTASKFVRLLLKDILGGEVRKVFAILTATPKDFEDDSFKSRYNVTDDEIEEFQNKIKNSKQIQTIQRNLQKFYETEMWKSLMSLSATTEDLLDLSYRTRCGLGELTESVTEKAREYSGGDNFFCSPQWREAFQQYPEVFTYKSPDLYMGMAVGYYFNNLTETFVNMSEDDD